ncbi:F-box only protein 43 [Alosa sapidissima]|uniref:F-box only protein 43 n=1 Tax=Alosa sapidissima TaxID=34773 RepID=UPI001C098DEE|nr:F-box only protein 43 [Alosa sapidissima]XP_041964281.1 F-box only protein 43 [Alosa sapidissima]
MEMEYSQGCTYSKGTNVGCRGSQAADNMNAPHTPVRKIAGAIYNVLGHYAVQCELETPKENLDHSCLSVSLNTPKIRSKVLPRCPARSPSKEPAFKATWCETPKVSKKDASLRRRLLESKSATDSKMGSSSASENHGLALSLRFKNDGPLQDSLDFDSPDSSIVEPFATSTLKAENTTLCGRSWRSMFLHVRTSTLEEGELGMVNSPFQSKPPGCVSDADLDDSIISGLFETCIPQTPQTPQCGKFMPAAKDDLKTPINHLAANLSENLSILSTPSLSPFCQLDGSVCADSGFSSLGLDKSQNSSVDYDGSFQELVSAATPRGKEAPRQAEVKRRSRLERQRRLSTLKEGGSQSEDDAKATSCPPRTELPPPNEPSHHFLSSCDGGVFLDRTPLSASQLRLEDLSLTPALQVVHAMSKRSARMLPEQTSLEELLRSAEKDPQHVPKMPLAGLIGRKMGLGKMDIMAELKHRNLRHVLAMILSQLPSEDVYNFGQVSDVWDEIITQNKKASHRRKSHVKELKKAHEMGSALHVPDAETRLNLVCRSALKSVQAQSKTPCTTPSGRAFATPVQQNPKHFSKREEFLQVAKTLFRDEWLKPCPQCQHPAKCHSVKREGVCCRADCGFIFCTACLCAYHGSRECAHLSAKRRSKRDVLPGSAQSKRNIKRL